MDTKISVFNTLTNISQKRDRDFFDIIEEIKSEKNKIIVESIRKETDKDFRNKLKQTLECICWSGVFKTRKATAVLSRSGIICLDFDNIDIHSLSAKKAALAQDPYIFCVFVSPSGNGLKALMFYNPEANHKKIFEKINQKYPEIDKSGSDLARVCFTSYDPDLYFDLDKLTWYDEYKDFTPYTPPKKLATDSQDKTLDNLLKWWTNKFPPVQGKRNTNLFILACALFDFGITKNEIYSQLTYFSNGLSEKEIKTILESADKKTLENGSQNTKIFENKPFSKNNLEKKIEYFSQKNEFIKQIIHKVENGEIVDNNILPFWYYDIDSKTPKLKLNNSLFYDSLSKIGYRHFFRSKNDIEFGFIANNIVYEKTITQIKNEIRNLLESSQIAEKDKIIELIVKQDKSLYNKETMAYLELLDAQNELKPNTKKSFQFFKNCIVSIEKNKVEVLEYHQIDKWIWAHQIKPRDFKLNQDKEYLAKGNIYNFVLNTQNKDQNRFSSFCKTIGYMVKGYHSALERKIVVFVDGNNTNHNSNNGRRGKTVLLRDIISQYTPTTIINSSHGDLATDRFWLSSYNPGDRIICFNDLDGRKTELRQFYTLTDGFEVERKGKDKIILKDQEVPVIAVTCNHIPKFNAGETSSISRVQIIEFSDYYNIDNTPFNEFNCELGKWESESQEWALFDNFMIYCLTQYLDNGLDKAQPKEAILVALQSQIGEDRIDAFDELVEDKTIVTLDQSFEYDFNVSIGNNPDATNTFELSKLVDKKHLEVLFAKYAAVKGWKEVDGVRSSTRRSKRYQKI